MAKRKKFGNDWWGKKWISVFADITNEGRLTRGRRYANNGSIVELTINQNTVRAEVSGSRVEPYEVSIDFKPFTAKEDRTVLSVLEENPLLITQLLQQELPPELFDMLASKKVSLFPKRWSEVKAHCSCPDFANPCKHIAAVLYQLSYGIEENPFLIFNLRNTDLLAELNKETSKVAIETVPNWHEPFEDNEKIEHPRPYTSLRDTQFDLSTIPLMGLRLPELLIDKPSFYEESDAKKELTELYKTVALRADSHNEFNAAAFEDEAEMRAYLQQIRSINQVHWAVNTELQIQEIRYNGTNIWDKEESLLPFIDALSEVPIEYTSHFSPALDWFYHLNLFVLQILARGAFVPQIVACEAQKYRIRWLPALLLPEVRAQWQKLSERLASDALACHRKVGRQKIKTFIDGEEAALVLCSLYLQAYIRDFAYRKSRESEFQEAFILGHTLHFHRFDEQNKPMLIHLWLQKFFLYDKHLQPIVYIEECEMEEEDFELSVKVASEQQVQSPEHFIDFKSFMSDTKFEQKRNQVWQNIYLLSEYLPALKTYLDNRAEQKVRISLSDFSVFFQEALPLFKLMGVKVLLPKTLQKILVPKAQVKVSRKEGGSSGLLNLDKILSFDWEVVIGETPMSAREFKMLLGNTSGLVRLQDRYVWIDQAHMDKLLAQLENQNKNRRHPLQTLILGETSDAKLELDEDIQKLLEPLLQTETHFETPTNLEATLRPYQEKGYQWLCRNAALGLGAILADDMGLGKTLQTIAFLLKLKNDKVLHKTPALIVVPTTLISNWQQEFAKFAPDFQIYTYYGAGRIFPDAKTLKRCDAVLTSYGIARIDKDKLEKIKWASLVIDEAQNIKNNDTAQSKALKSIAAKTKIALSGTPVENRLSEYWSIFDFIYKGYLGNQKQFYEDYGKPIEKERSQEALERFKQVTAPFVMRRVKTDKSIIADLPDKISTNHYAQLTAEQTALYQNLVNQTLEQIEQAEGIKRKGLILKLLGALKQICNHPAQYLKDGRAEAAFSGKTQLLIDLLQSIDRQGDKTLIFTQFTQMGHLLKEIIQKEMAYEPLFLHGGLSLKKRKAMIAHFTENPYPPVFILSLKAGGTGLNLTQANHVIHYDLWWNPAVEAQATDRSFRIGQQKNVLVHRFITQDTLEQQIDAMIEKKKELAELTVETGESWLTELSNDELKKLLNI
ncbi:MAG: SWIM zinc finger family protein [Bernardetiaceae bacterium]|nr:SWIM zinc finger family protein [Bernardetiaceae bacterium]